MLNADQAQGRPIIVTAMMMAAITQPTAIHRPPKTIQRILRRNEKGPMATRRLWRILFRRARSGFNGASQINRTWPQRGVGSAVSLLPCWRVRGFGFGGLPLFGFRLFRLHPVGEVLVYDVGDLCDDLRMQTGRFLDRHMRQARVRGEVDIAELTLKSWTWTDLFAKAVVLIKIHEVKNVLGHLMRMRGVKRNDELDRDVLRVERIGGVDRRVGSQGMADEDHDVLVAARITVGDAPRRRLPAVGTINPRGETLTIEPFGQRVHAARKDVGQAAKQIDLDLPRRNRRLCSGLCGRWPDEIGNTKTDGAANGEGRH